MLRKWWGVADGYTTPIAEIDLQVGGRYRLGMLSPDDDELKILAGEYLVIQPPEKLVFTWGVETNGVVRDVSTITIRLKPTPGGTELILRHEFIGPEEMTANFRAGWTGMLSRLPAALVSNPAHGS